MVCVLPADQIPYVVGALAGTANKQMMAEAIAQGLNPVGLSLADGGLCDVTQLDPELGNVGDCKPKIQHCCKYYWRKISCQ